MANVKLCYCVFLLTSSETAKHTIAQLVEMKNQDPLRGRDHRSPLEIIDLGDVEKLMLKQQGYTPDDIPADGVELICDVTLTFPQVEIPSMSLTSCQTAIKN